MYSGVPGVPMNGSSLLAFDYRLSLMDESGQCVKLLDFPCIILWMISIMIQVEATLELSPLIIDLSSSAHKSLLHHSYQILALMPLDNCSSWLTQTNAWHIWGSHGTYGGQVL